MRKPVHGKERKTYMERLENLEKLLEYYETVIDVEHHARTLEKLKKNLRFEKTDSICLRTVYADYRTFKPYSMEEIHTDIRKMMFNELLGNLSIIETKDDSVPMIRANYGVGSLPCAFGLKSTILNGNMPWVTALPKEEVRRVVDAGVPDFRTGFGQRILDTYEFYRETLARYPKCQAVIKLFHPDYQGPLDDAHLLYGSDIYLDMYEDPDFVHEVLSLVTDTYIDRMKRVKPYLDDETDGCCYHWQCLYPGALVLRNDTAVNLSPEMYREFSQTYDNRIIEAFGPASMHFCGRADHWVFALARTPGIVGLNFGRMQKLVFGEKYLEFLAPEVTEKKLPIIGYSITKQDYEEIDFERFGRGVAYILGVQNKAEAEAYRARR